MAHFGSWSPKPCIAFGSAPYLGKLQFVANRIDKALRQSLRRVILRRLARILLYSYCQNAGMIHYLVSGTPADPWRQLKITTVKKTAGKKTQVRLTFKLSR